MPQNTIMIVEDEVVVSADIRVKLEQLGYRVPSIVRYGEKVLDAARQAEPDLVLMDVKLKGDMDGIEAARQIQEHLNLPVVFLTAFADEETLARAKATQPYAYLKKPVRLDDLRISIDMGLYKARMDRKLKQSELRFRTLADFTYDWETWTGPDGKYIYLSPSCERITGRTQQAFYDNPRLLIEIAVPQDKERIEKHICGSNPSDTKVHRIEFRISHSDGQERWLEHVCRPVYAPDGTYIGRRASNRDITCRKNMEIERENLIAELQEALKNVKTLSGLIPICASCKKIRDDKGYWNQVEKYISEHSEARFSHGLCPSCVKKLYPELDGLLDD